MISLMSACGNQTYSLQSEDLYTCFCLKRSKETDIEETYNKNRRRRGRLKSLLFVRVTVDEEKILVMLVRDGNEIRIKTGR